MTEGAFCQIGRKHKEVEVAKRGRESGQDIGTKLPNVADIDAMDRDCLVALWSAVLGGVVPHAMSQGLLRRFLAYEVQAQAQGGLNREDLNRLDRLTDGGRRAGTTKLAHGARFLREWNGITHVVERNAADYSWNGNVYASLTAIAKEITGAHWSGPRFFGVTAGAKSAASHKQPARISRKEGTK